MFLYYKTLSNQFSKYKLKYQELNSIIKFMLHQSLSSKASSKNCILQMEDSWMRILSSFNIHHYTLGQIDQNYKKQIEKQKKRRERQRQRRQRIKEDCKNNQIERQNTEVTMSLLKIEQCRIEQGWEKQRERLRKQKQRQLQKVVQKYESIERIIEYQYQTKRQKFKKMFKEYEQERQIHRKNSDKLHKKLQRVQNKLKTNRRMQLLGFNYRLRKEISKTLTNQKRIHRRLRQMERDQNVDLSQINKLMEEMKKNQNKIKCVTSIWRLN